MMKIKDLKKIILAISSYCELESEYPERTTYYRDEDGKLHFKLYFDGIYLPSDTLMVFDADEDTLGVDDKIYTTLDDIDDSNIPKAQQILDGIEKMVVNTDEGYIDIIPKDQGAPKAESYVGLNKIADESVALVPKHKLLEHENFESMLKLKGKNVLLLDEDEEEIEDPLVVSKALMVVADSRYPTKSFMECLQKLNQTIAADDNLKEAASTSFILALYDYSESTAKDYFVGSYSRVYENEHLGGGIFDKCGFWKDLKASGWPSNFGPENLIVLNRESFEKKVMNNANDGFDLTVVASSETYNKITGIINKVSEENRHFIENTSLGDCEKASAEGVKNILAELNELLEGYKKEANKDGDKTKPGLFQGKDKGVENGAPKEHDLQKSPDKGEVSKASDYSIAKEEAEALRTNAIVREIVYEANLILTDKVDELKKQDKSTFGKMKDIYDSNIPKDAHEAWDDLQNQSDEADAAKDGSVGVMSGVALGKAKKGNKTGFVSNEGFADYCERSHFEDFLVNQGFYAGIKEADTQETPKEDEKPEESEEQQAENQEGSENAESTEGTEGEEA